MSVNEGDRPDPLGPDDPPHGSTMGEDGLEAAVEAGIAEMEPARDEVLPESEQEPTRVTVEPKALVVFDHNLWFSLEEPHLLEKRVQAAKENGDYWVILSLERPMGPDTFKTIECRVRPGAIVAVGEV